MGKLRSGKRRPPWNATKQQAEAFSKERVLRDRVAELEIENVHVRKERQDLNEALQRANKTIGDLRRTHAEITSDAVIVTFTPSIRGYLEKLSRGGLYPPSLAGTVEEIVRLHVRELVSSGKVMPW